VPWRVKHTAIITLVPTRHQTRATIGTPLELFINAQTQLREGDVFGCNVSFRAYAAAFVEGDLS
jgi:hypothetical protein